MKQLNITGNQEIAPGVFSLTFKKFFDFLPGQVVKITTSPSVAPRMYSIASSTSEDIVQLIYDIKPEGQLTNLLKELKPGNDLFVSLPFGQFLCAEGKAWWIATGTGIAPFYSMMRSGRVNDITLIHGVRRPEYLLFNAEFSSRLKSNYFQCCSGVCGKDIFQGRVTDYLKNIDHLPSNTRFYLCGSAEMVVDVRDILIEKKVAFGNIFSEIYF